MTSRTGSWSASPAWVGSVLAAQTRWPAARPAGGRQAGAPRPALRLERGRRSAHDRAVAAALLVVWVALWSVFVAGVVLPSADLRGAPVAAARAQRATAPASGAIARAP